MTEYIDITPLGLKQPGGQEKMNAVLDEIDRIKSNLLDATVRFYREAKDARGSLEDLEECFEGPGLEIEIYLQQLDAKQHEMVLILRGTPAT